jgi:hypothetical protein
MAEAGIIVEAVNWEFINPNNITEIGDVFLGRGRGKISDQQITFYISIYP